MLRGKVGVLPWLFCFLFAKTRSTWDVFSQVLQWYPEILDANRPIFILYIPQILVGIPTPLKNMKVSWDDYSQYMESHKNVPNHQPDSE